MIENLSRLEELLSKINIELDSLERLFGGCRVSSEECCEAPKEECIMDTVNISLQKADYALCVLERINNILKGGNR